MPYAYVGGTDLSGNINLLGTATDYDDSANGALTTVKRIVEPGIVYRDLSLFTPQLETGATYDLLFRYRTPSPAGDAKFNFLSTSNYAAGIAEFVVGGLLTCNGLAAYNWPMAGKTTYDAVPTGCSNAVVNLTGLGPTTMSNMGSFTWDPAYPYLWLAAKGTQYVDIVAIAYSSGHAGVSTVWWDCVMVPRLRARMMINT